MKILQIISSIDPKGGGPIEGLIQQGIELSAAGHELHTASLDAPGQTIDPRMNSTAIFLLGPSKLGYAFSFLLEPWLRENGKSYDVIIVHGMWQYHGYCVAKVARSIGLRYVIFLHGMLDPYFNERFPLKFIKKWLYWPWGEYRVLAGAKLVLFTTAEELRLARKSFWLYKVRERLVGYGIKRRETPAAEAREVFLSKYPHLRQTRNLLFLSRIHPKKGCDMLVDAFSKFAAQYPELHLVLAGPDGEGWQATLEAQVKQQGLTDRVTFTGMLSGAIKWGAYDCADAFVLPSHQENFGIVVAEALTSGLPVLTTYKVNIWQEIEDGNAGLIKEDTPLGTQDLLEKWLNMGAEQRDEMRVAAKQCFEKNFEIGKVSGNLLNAIEEVGGGKEFAYSFVNRLPRFGS